MAFLPADFPKQYVNPYSRSDVIAYIRGLGLPSRFARGLLQTWGSVVGVYVAPYDYLLVEAKRDAKS